MLRPKRMWPIATAPVFACVLSGVIAPPSIARCARVAQANTGNYNNSSCAEPKTLTSNYIKIKALRKYLGHGVWCAETEQENTGNYNNSECAEPKSGGKYILIAGRYKSHSSNGHGHHKAGPIVLEGGGATLECSGSEGTWTILSEGVEATSGTQLSDNTTTWSGCKAKTNEVKEITPKVKECTLDFNDLDASVATECTVTTTVLFLTCTIHILPEKAAEKINLGLETNVFENSGENLLIKAEDTGITMTASGTCPGVTGTKEGKQKVVLTEEGVERE